tara:strand:- start:101 stop:469 length:369 start_codon:yes stop_codon:yes gene_type:complete
MKTLVTKKAPSLMKGIVNMMNGAKENFDFWTAPRDGQPKSSYCLEQLADWDSKTEVKMGRKYVKVIQDRSVFAFIVKEDDGKFKKGDILKASGYNAPALNQPRGNVLDGNYYIAWTGPLYLN